jgi:hypothetical protein
MSFSSEYLKLRKKKLKEKEKETDNLAKEKETETDSLASEYLKRRSKQIEENKAKETEKETEKEEKRTWFTGGAFSDGWQFGDITKTAIGTVNDIGENVTQAVADATENLVDTAAYGVG